MALPTLAETKSYLRVEETDEDTVITDLLLSAKAWAEALIGSPIIAESRTFTSLHAAHDVYGRHGLYLPIWPVTSPITVTDADGVTVGALTYSVDPRSGLVQGLSGAYFGNYPYSVTATVGLSAHPEYTTKLQPIVRSLIMGLVSVMHRQRNPDVTSESAGGGESTSYDMAPVPPRLMGLVKLLRGPRIR